MRTLGHVLLWLGVLGGSFVAVRDPQAVAWSAYAAAAAVAIVGVGLLRRTARDAQGTSTQIERRMDGLRDALVRLDDGLSALCEGLRGDDDVTADEVYGVHERLDAALAEPLATFADGREAMIPALGLTAYGEVMTRFAAAERLINRTWSASADGYVDEVRRCLEQASALMGQARRTFEGSSGR